MKSLTKAEEQVMQILWQLDKCLIRAIIDEIPEPKPAYTTISTIVRILETKGFVSHKTYGNTHEYFPLIAKKDYSDKSLNRLVVNYFDNSCQKLVSAFTKNDNISIKDLESMKEIIQQELNNKKGEQK